MVCACYSRDIIYRERPRYFFFWCCVCLCLSTFSRFHFFFASLYLRRVAPLMSVGHIFCFVLIIFFCCFETFQRISYGVCAGSRVRGSGRAWSHQPTQPLLATPAVQSRGTSWMLHRKARARARAPAVLSCLFVVCPRFICLFLWLFSCGVVVETLSSSFSCG